MTDNNGLGVMLKMPLLTDSSGQTLSRTEADPKEGNSNQNQVVKTKRRIQRLKRRVKDPFNKKKIKNLKRRECVLEKTVEGLSKCLLDMIYNHPRGETILGSVGTLQIDCTNKIHYNSEEEFDELQKAIDTLTNAANQLLNEITAESEIRKRENTELKVDLQRSEIKLDEVKDLSMQCLSKLRQYDDGKVQSLRDLKDLHEALLADTTEENIASDGISAIRLCYAFEEEYDFLPFKTKLLVTRLLHLFGNGGQEALCKALNTEISDDIIETCIPHGSEDSVKLQLNRDICAKILVDWVRKSVDNNGPVLFNVMKAHEMRRYEAKCRSHEERTTCQFDDQTQYQQGVFLEYHNDSSSSSNSSLSFDENYFACDSLERKNKQFPKFVSVERLSAKVLL